MLRRASLNNQTNEKAVNKKENIEGNFEKLIFFSNDDFSITINTNKI